MATEDTIDTKDIEKALNRTLKKYDDKAEAVLTAMGRVARNKVKARTPVGKKEKSKQRLKNTWRLQNVKEFGKAKVVRVISTAPHAHLVEQGHKIVTRERSRNNGRYAKENVRLGKTSKLNAAAKKVMGVKSGGYVEGKKMLEDTMKEVRDKFFSEAEKMLDELISEAEK